MRSAREALARLRCEHPRHSRRDWLLGHAAATSRLQPPARAAGRHSRQCPHPSHALACRPGRPLLRCRPPQAGTAEGWRASPGRRQPQRRRPGRAPAPRQSRQARRPPRPCCSAQANAAAGSHWAGADGSQGATAHTAFPEPAHSSGMTSARGPSSARSWSRTDGSRSSAPSIAGVAAGWCCLSRRRAAEPQSAHVRAVPTPLAAGLGLWTRARSSRRSLTCIRSQ